MLKKLIYGGVVSLGLLGLSNCFCDPVPPYVDFSEIEVHTLDSELGHGDSLIFYVEPKEPLFISQRISQAISFPQAFATSCPHPGDQGMKFPVESMIITSNQDFDSTHKAGQNLNDLFLIGTYTDWAPVNDSLLNSNIVNFGWYEVQLLLTHSPSLGADHTFRIELSKSNQEIIVGSSEKITWK